MRLGTVKRFLSIVKATALEITSEPLSLLLLSSSIALAVFAPALHYHQFGESTRMARDAGLSALLIGGNLFAIVGVIRSVRRELESGTAAVALSHPVSRFQFFLAKAAGAYVAFSLFAIAVGAMTMTMVNGAALGAVAASKTGDIPKMWGPSFAFGVAAIVSPYVVGAMLNRVWRCRFALSAFVITICIAFVSVFYYPNLDSISRLLEAEVLLCIPPMFFVFSSAAAAICLKTNAAGAVSAILVVCFFPFAGNYCLSEALSKGGSISWRYVVLAAFAALPAILAALLVGIAAMRSKDV